MHSSSPTLSSSQTAADIKWYVKAGSETALEEVAQATLRAASTSPGFMGGHLLQPTPDAVSGEWQLILQFTTPEELRAWQTSTLCRACKAQSDVLTVGAARVQRINGLEGWFTGANRGVAGTPPKWKMALVTMLGIYPTIRLVPMLLEPVVVSWPPWLGSLAVTSVVMVLMTWLIMPFLTHLFKGWLYATPSTDTLDA
ncbi:antibiotic biosynthesis monooxygenase [Hymenobacter sp. GOD-10R]|uniref:antibiotic biosynthesis monooxygenase n=1 Tax=Hymenobacter sp. GOD-10R TaxID=3093922 RepID=UPI002D783D07|nr:antibiotic biosynthesis monooxygenase [Hymenobacter sp. GOD-10R]WRQ26110.1 antibiotic biosynthesis monooxygenase [Hymenobacter sp. GOD-10R]